MSSTTTTYFDTIEATYHDIQRGEDQGLDTVKFLAATESLIKILDLLESAAFGPVKSDLAGNVKKIRDKYTTNPAKYPTLQSIVLDEQAQGKNRPTIEGLLWLKRGLEFCAKALRDSLQNTSEELSVSFSRAYEATLKPFHTFLIRPVFALAMKACPSRQSFYTKLGTDPAAVHRAMDAWLTDLERVLATLVKFYKDGDYGK